MGLSDPEGHPRLGWGPHLGVLGPPLRSLGSHPGFILPLLWGFVTLRGQGGSREAKGTWEQWGHPGAAGTPEAMPTQGSTEPLGEMRP